MSGSSSISSSLTPKESDLLREIRNNVSLLTESEQAQAATEMVQHATYLDPPLAAELKARQMAYLYQHGVLTVPIYPSDYQYVQRQLERERQENESKTKAKQEAEAAKKVSAFVPTVPRENFVFVAKGMNMSVLDTMEDMYKKRTCGTALDPAFAPGAPKNAK